MSFIEILFYISAVFTVMGSMAVLFSKNLVHACVYLLCTLIGVAGLYATLGADFIAATQIVIYVGGVVILLLFAIMLTGGTTQGIMAKFGLESVPSMGNIRTYLLGCWASIIIFLVMYKLLSTVMDGRAHGVKPFESTVEEIGIKLLTDHILTFEISSVLLLGALVGAAIIARPVRDS